MKLISNRQEMREFGFGLLTGEACGLVCRLLFDVIEIEANHKPPDLCRKPARSRVK